MKKYYKPFAIILCLCALCLCLAGCSIVSGILDKLGNSGPQQQRPDDTVHALATPRLSAHDGVLSWRSVTGATQYRVKYTEKETGNGDEIVTKTTSLSIAKLNLPAGVYTFVVRAECPDGTYTDSDYTAQADAVMLTITGKADLSEVNLSVYKVDADTLLAVWTSAEGVAAYHVGMGAPVDSTANFALLSADATKDCTVTLTATGKPGYDFANQQVTHAYQASSASTVSSVPYDKNDGTLMLSVSDATAVVIDGQTLNADFSGQVQLGESIMEPLSLGTHYLQTYKGNSVSHALLVITDTRPVRFVNGGGVAVEQIQYVLNRDLVVYLRTYANTVQSVQLDDVALDNANCVIGTDAITVRRTYLKTKEEGDWVLQVYYLDTQQREQNVSLTIHVEGMQAFIYDISDATDLAITDAPTGVSAVYGGGITNGDYSVAGTTVSFSADYLATLDADTYEYWLQGSGAGKAVSVSVYDSGCAPHDVRLSYDEHATYCYGLYRCNCGGTDHTYSLDGADYAAAPVGKVSLGTLDKSQKHTFRVHCNTNDKTTSHVISPSLEAATYMDKRYQFEGRNPDCYISCLSEFADVLRYLSYAGNIDYSASTYGTSKISVYLGNNVLRKSGDVNSALSALLKEARQSFSAPYNCLISAAGDSFDSDERTGVLTISYTFTDYVPRTRKNGIAAEEKSETRPLLTQNATARTTYIENCTRSEPVANVQELADLPLGVRPTFVGADDATAMARQAYNVALAICQQYVSDGMTVPQKLQAMYDYLSLHVTYDYYALIWYEINNYRNEQEYDIYRQWQSASAKYSETCSDADRKAISGCSGYADASLLAAQMAADNPSNSFWQTWHDNFAQFESDQFSGLIAYARQYVAQQGYEGTLLQSDVEVMCAKPTYVQAIQYLQSMLSCTAFDAAGALVHSVAVCDGMADAFRLLCLVEGIECIKVTGLGINSSGSSENHAWNKVRVGDVWYCVDSTWSKSSGCVFHRYFMRSDADLAADHYEQNSSGQRAVEVLALASAYNYYEDTIVAGHNLCVADKDEFSTVLTALYNAGEKVVELRFDYAINETQFADQLDKIASKLNKKGLSYTYSFNGGFAMITFK